MYICLYKQGCENQKVPVDNFLWKVPVENGHQLYITFLVTLENEYQNIICFLYKGKKCMSQTAT